MQKKDIEQHLDSYQDSDTEETKNRLEQENDDDDNEDTFKTLPLCSRALVQDVVHFDLSCLDFLHKLGEGKPLLCREQNPSFTDFVYSFSQGGFGTVRACKFRKATDIRGNSPAVSGNSTCASSDDEWLIDRPKAAAEESKFARSKTTRTTPPPKAKNSSSVLE